MSEVEVPPVISWLCNLSYTISASLSVSTHSGSGPVQHWNMPAAGQVHWFAERRMIIGQIEAKRLFFLFFVG